MTRVPFYVVYTNNAKGGLAVVALFSWCRAAYDFAESKGYSVTNRTHPKSPFYGVFEEQTCKNCGTPLTLVCLACH